MRLLITIVVFCSSAYMAVSQEDNDRLYRQIRTIEAMNMLKKEDPQTSKRQAKIEQFISKQSRLIKAEQVTLPLIFHVFYTDETDRVNLEQITTQIEALNRDFANLESDKELEVDRKEGFSRRATETEISFCLADTKGKLPAVNYIQTSTTGWQISNEIKDSESGGVEAFDPKSFINVWIAQLADDVSGYAQMPGGPDLTDGIVIDYRFFGMTGTAIAPYNEGKTLTHLLGNYLGLYPLWGQYNCTDDYVFDTPIHNYPNFKETGYKHISTCDGLPVEMVSNFMDNTDDTYLHFFTHGQKSRMQAILAKGGARAGLVKSKKACDEIDPASLQSLDLFSQETTIVEETLPPSIRLQPNPADQLTQLEIEVFSEAKGDIRVYDLNGKLHYAQVTDLVPGAQQFNINCQDWTAGIYFFQVVIDDFILSERLILK